MNREQRRKFEKQIKKINQKNKSLGKPTVDLQTAYGNAAIRRVQDGIADQNDFNILKNSKYSHLDNELLVPDGTKVRLNVKEIQSRPQKDLSEKFIDWVQRHADQEFSITREGASKSLVCLEEDISEGPIAYDSEGEPLPHVRWLWDLYTDLLVYYEPTGEYLPLAEIEEKEEATLDQDLKQAEEKQDNNADNSVME